VSNPHDWLKQFMVRPDHLDCVTVVDCLHVYHGNVTLYFTLEQFQDNFMGAIRSMWANEYTFIVRPAK
jgi:hypothetical protein